MAIIKPMTEPTESIEVLSSEDGNIEPAAIAPVTPSSVPKEEAPAATPAETATPAAPELFELPDGRKVDGVTLSREFKDNFLPDYTRKSQELARLAKGINNPDITPPTVVDPMADPEYAPKDYAELAKQIEERTLRALEARDNKAKESAAAIENVVTEQLNAVKATDKNVNENALFLHATKYHFTDLRLAHQNMTDMAKLAKTVETTTVKNIQKRSDPVSIIPGGSSGQRQDPSMFENARDYLRSLQ